MSEFNDEKGLRHLHALFPSQPISYRTEACVCLLEAVCVQGKSPGSLESSVNCLLLTLKVLVTQCVRLFVTLWTVASQAPLSMKFSMHEYWSRLPFPSPGDLPNPGIEPRSSALQSDSLPSETPGKPLISAGNLTNHRAQADAQNSPASAVGTVGPT